MRALLALTLLSTACTAPAVLRVDVVSERSDLDAIEVQIQDREGGSRTTCLFDRSGSVNPGCSLMEGDVRWQGDDQLTFVLYGATSAEAALDVKGMVMQRVVAHVHQDVALPDTEGEQSTATIVLRHRTAVHRRCSAAIDLSPQRGLAPETTTAMTLTTTPDGEEIVLAALGLFAKARYRTNTSTAGCVIELRPSTPAEPCFIRPGGLAAGDVDPNQEGEELVAMCSTQRGAITMRPQDQLRVLGLDGAPSILASTRAPRSRISAMSLVNVDDDESLEAVVVAGPDGTSTVAPPLGLVFWSPGEDPAAALVRAQQSRAHSEGVPVDQGAVFTPRPGASDEVLVAGYGQRVTRIFDGANQGALPGNARRAYLHPVTGVADGAPFLIQAHGANRGEIFVRTDQIVPPGETGFPSRQESLGYASNTPAREIAIAVGDIDGEGVPSTVVVRGDQLHTSELRTSRFAAAFERRKLEEAPTSNEQMHVRLANIDGVTGAEVLAYRVTGTQVYAYRGDGSLVRGWPVQGLGTEGKIRHVILDDLDDDGSLEVIAFSDGRLDIVSLGGDSFDPAATPWPMALRDRQRSGAHRGEAAP